MSRLSPPPRSHSRASIAASDSTYHSFRDVELDEPSVTPRISKHSDFPSDSMEMRRQDSGYESMTPRDTRSCRRRTSAISASSSTYRPRTRLQGRRAPRSGVATQISPDRAHSHHPAFSKQPDQQQGGSSYFHFPHFPFPDQDQDPALSLSNSDIAPGTSSYPVECSYPHTSPPVLEMEPEQTPPQTTHYWTSDRTRRLEYAAIDAATKGVRGWVMRHVVPDCFIPKDRRRTRFEDDGGSVVRYRLELEEEDGTEREGADRSRKRKGWWFGTRTV